MDLRIATALFEVNGTMTDVKQLLYKQLDLRDRVARCEHDIDELKRRPH
jgi:hypothetical protein